MKNLLLSVLEVKKSLSESNDNNSKVLTWLMNMFEVNSTVNDMTIVTNSGISVAISKFSDTQIQFTDLTNHLTAVYNRIEMTGDEMISPYVSVYDVISSVTDSSALNDFICDVCSTFATQSTISINQLEAIANKYRDVMTNNDIDNLLSYFATTGDSITMTNFLNVMSELYQNVKNSYTEVESGDASRFVLDTTKVSVQTFVGISILSIVGSVLGIAALVLPKVLAIAAILLSAVLSLFGSVINQSVQDHFVINDRVGNDFFNTPILAFTATGMGSSAIKEGSVDIAYKYCGDSVSYFWRPKSEVSQDFFVNRFAYASTNLNLLRNNYSNIPNKKQNQLLINTTADSVLPGYGMSTIQNIGVSVSRQDIIVNLTDDFRYSHEELLNLQSNELAAMYCYSLWSFIISLMDMDLSNNSQYIRPENAWTRPIWIYCLPNNDTLTDVDVVRGDTVMAQFKHIVSGLTNIMYHVMNYNGNSCDFEYAAYRIKFIASCYAWMMDNFLKTGNWEYSNQDYYNNGVFDYYKYSQVTESRCLYGALAPNDGSASNLYGLWQIGKTSALYNEIMYGRTDNNLTGNDEDIAYRTSVDGIPSDRTFEVPEYTPNALAKTLVVIGIVTLVIATASIVAVKAIRKFSIKKQLDYTNSLSQLRWNYLAEPTKENFDAYYKASKKYNLFGKILGWGSYDVISGRTTASSVGNNYTSNEITGVQEDVSSILKLIK